MNLNRIGTRALVSGLVLLTLIAGGANPVSAQGPAKADANPGKPTRIVAGISSAEKATGALEFIVAELANKKANWEQDLYPNIEVFLIGVALDQPIRFDQLFDPAVGRLQPEPSANLMQAMIPVSNFKEFLDDNLSPIGIDAKKDAKEKGLYALSGEVYEGFLRELTSPDHYAIFYKTKEALPADTASPAILGNELGKDSLVFLQLHNTAETIPDRKAAFDYYREIVLDGLKKGSTESADQFALRKRVRLQSIAAFEQWFVESKAVDLKLNVNTEKADAPSQLTLTALPDTDLAANFSKLKEQASYFGGIAAPADAVVALRVNLPIEAAREAGYREIYELSRPVVKEKIASDEKADAAEKTARQSAASLLLDVFSESSKLGRVDGFLDVIPSKGKHALVMGIRCNGKDKINQIIDLLPAANKTWTLTKDVAKAGDVTIHQLKLRPDAPKSLTDFYGTDRQAFLAVTDDAFWLSTGADAQSVLTSRIEAVAAAKDLKPDGVALSLKMHAQPVLRTMNDFIKEADLGVLNAVTLKEARAEQLAAKDKEKPKGKDEAPAKRPTSALKDFQWQEAAIAGMEGLDDTFELKLVLTEDDTLSGEGNVQKGVLKALGVVIAKFANENLK
ncbi:hypothetical protein [Planctomicrobium sp. SH664]|uniref:hypothetical protein n=1 Tax=Planctomicrobium sp. SH664 TaxID=3448125 RepID=UPI003F5B8A53